MNWVADLPYYISRFRKGLVTLAGMLTTLLTANLLPDGVAGQVSWVLGIVTIVLNAMVPNAEVRSLPLDAPGKHAL